MKNYLVEFIGTFFLVFTVGCAAVYGGAGDLAPLAIGSALMVMVFAGGHRSGGHYNPAVTLAVWIRGKCDTKDVGPYMGSQILGAAVAAMAARFLFEDEKQVEVFNPNLVKALLAEVLFTFALAYVVLNVATAKGTGNNSFYGLAIGFTVLTGAFAVGGVSLGAFNPAVAVGLSLLGKSAWGNVWIYLLADFAGGILAGLVFNFLEGEEK